MDKVALVVGIGWTLAGLLTLALSIPLSRGRVGRNAFYGARFPQSFASDEAWYAINRFAGRRCAAWSILMILVGLISFFLPLEKHTGLTWVLGFAPLIFFLIPIFQTWRYARDYSAARPDRLR